MTEMPVLTTERLSVRPLTSEDFPAYCALEPDIPDDRQRATLAWRVASYRELGALLQPPYGERAIALRGRRHAGRAVRAGALVRPVRPAGDVAARLRREARAALSARRRHVLDARSGAPGQRLRDRGGGRAGRLRLRRDAPAADRGHHGAHEHRLAGGDEATGHAPRPQPGARSRRGSRWSGSWTPSAGRLAGHDQPGLVREDHRLGAVAQPELREHVLDVGLHRALGERAAGGDLGVASGSGRPAAGSRARAGSARRSGPTPPGRTAARGCSRRTTAAATDDASTASPRRPRGSRRSAPRAGSASAGSRWRRRRSRPAPWSSDSKVVSTSTRPRPSSAIAAVAAMPSITGIRRSISTTSGRSSRARSTASAPFSASADDPDVVRGLERRPHARCGSAARRRPRGR